MHHYYLLTLSTLLTYFNDVLFSGLNSNSSTSPTRLFILNPDNPAPATPKREPITATPIKSKVTHLKRNVDKSKSTLIEGHIYKNT